MKTANPHDLHETQAHILKELLFHPDRKFSELAPPGVSSDQLAFHVKRLLELNLVNKLGDRYELTAAGKEFANRFDADAPHMRIERQAKLGAIVVAIRMNAGKQEYLMQQRLKQPYYGFYGFVGGKIRWGETLEEAAAREFAEEAGLAATLIPAGIEHKMDYDKATGELLEDKFFFFFRAEKPHGEFRATFPGGQNAWLTKDEILKLPDLFPDVPEGLAIIDGKEFCVIERRYQVEKY